MSLEVQDDGLRDARKMLAKLLDPPAVASVLRALKSGEPLNLTEIAQQAGLSQKSVQMLRSECPQLSF